MLTLFVYIYILKALVYLFMEEPHPTVPSVKTVDALASYISNYKFKFKFKFKN